jgi:FHA domain
MAAIREICSGQTRLLEPDHLVGRAPPCALRIDQRYVSARHAIVRWTGDRWELKDLGSRNGTFLDGRKIPSGEEHVVQKGTRIGFGKVEQEWELVDTSAPSVMAVPIEGGEPVFLDGDLLTLPSTEEPLVTIYPNPEGGWLLEQPDESTTPITNLQTFEIGGRSWRFCCPEQILKTSIFNEPPAFEVRHLVLTFSVSRDEEHVALHASCGSRTFDLGARTHHYTLLTLARRRLDDAAQGLPETSCGWVYQEDIAIHPHMTSAELNIDVCRLRKQFAQLGVSDPAAIIERRPRTRQLRIGTGRISIVVL